MKDKTTELLIDTLSQLCFNGHLDARIKVGEARVILEQYAQENESHTLKTQRAKAKYYIEKCKTLEEKLKERNKSIQIGIDAEKDLLIYRQRTDGTWNNVSISPKGHTTLSHIATNPNDSIYEEMGQVIPNRIIEFLNQDNEQN